MRPPPFDKYARYREDYQVLLLARDAIQRALRQDKATVVLTEEEDVVLVDYMQRYELRGHELAEPDNVRSTQWYARHAMATVMAVLERFPKLPPEPKVRPRMVTWRRY